MPESFRDVIQTAIDAGAFFTEAGKPIKEMSILGLAFGVTMDQAIMPTKQKITDMTDLGITFGDTMKDAADKIALAVQALIRKYEELAETIRKVPDAPKPPPTTATTAPKLPGGGLPTIPKVTIPKIAPVVLPNFDLLPMARGGRGMVKKPTLFLAGEEGPEEFAFSGTGKRFGSGSRKAATANIHVHVIQDGRETAYAMAKYIPEVIDLTVGR